MDGIGNKTPERSVYESADESPVDLRAAQHLQAVANLQLIGRLKVNMEKPDNITSGAASSWVSIVLCPKLIGL
jgi:hypothetical protein